MVSKLNFKHITYSLVIAYFILLIFHIKYSLDYFEGLIDQESWPFRKFNFDEEKNFPSIFSTLLLLGTSVTLLLTHLRELKLNYKNRLFISLSLIHI